MAHDGGTEVGVTRPPAKEGHRLLADHPELGRGKEGPAGSGGSTALWCPDFGLQKCERVSFCCFKRPNLCYLTTSAPGNEDTILEKIAPGPC